MDNFAANDIFLLFGTIATLVHAGEDINLECDDNANKSASSSLRPSEDSKQQNSLSVKSMFKDKAIEIYARKIFDNLKKTLKNLEPLDAGSVDRETVANGEYNITFQLQNIKLFNLGSFAVKKFKSLSNDSSAEFSIGVPSVKVKANYDVKGTLRGKKVDGKGDAEIHVSGVTIDNGKVAIIETPEEIQISSFNFCYDFKDMTIKQTGLNIEGLKNEEVTKFLNDTATKYLKDNRKKLCNRIATELKRRVNAKLRGKNRDQLSELMK